MKKTTEYLRNENAKLKKLLQEKSQSLNDITAQASDNDRKVQTLLAEVSPLKERIAICEQQHRRVDERKLELETLRCINVEQNTAVKKLKADLQRITNYSEIQQRENEKAWREVASVRDEISALKQISAETQQRQLSEIQSTSTTSKQLQQLQRTGRRLRVLICVKFQQHIQYRSEFSHGIDSPTKTPHAITMSAITCDIIRPHVQRILLPAEHGLKSLRSKSFSSSGLMRQDWVV